MKQNIVEKKIAWGDLDPANIVYYPRYYEWIDASGHLFLEAIGLPHETVAHERQIGFSLAETGCRYAKPGRYHQQIRIKTTLEDLTPKTFTLRHTIHDASDDSLMVNGFEKRICLDLKDPAHIKARNIPDDVYRVLKAAMAP